MIPQNSCRNCRFIFRDGKYISHCRVGLIPDRLNEEHLQCFKWEEKSFDDVFNYRMNFHVHHPYLK